MSGKCERDFFKILLVFQVWVCFKFFKVKVFGIEFFELWRTSIFKFEKVCGREFFD